MSILMGILAVLFVFGLVIFVHELGHFLVAKKSGIRVERFSFGLGPEMLGFQWGETRYCLAWIPLGGEVRMVGENALEESEGASPPADPRSFYAKSWLCRSAVVLAGPAMNYVLAFFLFALLAFVWGEPRPTDKPIVGDLVKDYPALVAGIRPGDAFVAIDGKAVSTWNEMAEAIHASPGKTLKVELDRQGQVLTMNLVPRRDIPSGVGLIGVAPKMDYIKVGLFRSLERGANQCVGWSLFTLKYLGDKFVDREKPELSGPVGIATVIAKAAKNGFEDLLYLMALISVGIGLFNLFPIPMLDGGHLSFFLWEAVTRKPATKTVVKWANAVGFSILIGILLFATYSDILRLKPAGRGAEIVSQESAANKVP